MSPESHEGGSWWARLLGLFGIGRRSTPAPRAPQSPEGAAAPSEPSPPPVSVTPARAGSVRVLRTQTAPLHLGIDFGTRYTKVCFRDLGSDKSEVVTFARGTPRLEDALLGSHIELRDDLVLAGLSEAEWRRRAPLPGSVTLDFVKMRLARLDIPMGTGAWVPALVDGCDSPERVEALAAFFLARVIDRSCRWVTAERQDLLKERAPLWSFSIGVPVKYANSLALGRFRRVLGIAATWARRGVPESTTLAGACSAVRDLERVRWTTDVSVQAEIAAAVRSFITSPRALEGIYLYFDVGAGTLDGASFRFHRPPDKPSQVNFYSGEVEHLGVAAVAGVVAAATSLAVAEVERILAEPHSRDNLSGLLDDAERQIQNLIVKVIMCSKRVDGKEWRKGLDDLAQAYHRRRHANPAGPIPLFVGGGGSGSSFFRSAILSTYDERSLGNAGVRRYSLEEVPLPDDLDMSGMASEHFRRFAVAYGLSIPPEEGPDVDLPPPECEPPRRTPEPPVTDYQDLP